MENEKVFLTKQGVEKLKQELRNLIDVVRPEVIGELQAARSQGDLSENADYDAARNRQAQVESRIKELENMLSNIELIDDKAIQSNLVRLGSRVVIEDLSDSQQYEYLIVGSVESDPLNGKISNQSPLAQAIIGRGVGDKRTVKVANPYDVKIKKIIK